MQEQIVGTICRVGIFMICAQAMVHFRAQESYEKYLKLLVSVMVMIQLFLPVGSLLAHGSGGEAVRLGALLEQMEADMEQIEKQSEEAERFLEKMTLEEARSRMEGQSRQSVQEAAQGQGETRQEAAQGLSEIVIESVTIGE